MAWPARAPMPSQNRPKSTRPSSTTTSKARAASTRRRSKRSQPPWRSARFAALDPERSAGDRLLRTALNHFDRILTQRDFQSLMQQEMVRMRRGESEAMPVLVKNVFKPLMEKLQEAVHEGIETGELCQMDWLQVVYSVLGANVLYFLSAPMMRLIAAVRPIGPGRHRSPAQGRGAISRQRPVCRPRPWSAGWPSASLPKCPCPKVRNARVWRKCL